MSKISFFSFPQFCQKKFAKMECQNFCQYCHFSCKNGTQKQKNKRVHHWWCLLYQICPKAYKLLHETSHTPAIACKYTSGPWFHAIYKIQWWTLLFFRFWVPFLQEKWQYWQKFWHSILMIFFWQNCEKSKNWFLTLFSVTPTKIKLHKRTVCQMKGNFMNFVTYFMQSTRKTNIMSSRTQNMRLKFITSPFKSAIVGIVRSQIDVVIVT